MKYFIDTEFIEGFHKPLFGKRRHFIDLISIGIICEDGREYYAISNEFDPKDADLWVRDNVLSKIWDDLQRKENCKRARMGIEMIGDHSGQFKNKDLKYLLKVYGKPNKQIADEVHDFTLPRAMCENGEKCCMIYDPDESDMNSDVFHHKLKMKITPPEFYAYYADYDWVLFCSLFGRMINLPEFFPKYCKDLKQTFDEKQREWKNLNEDKRVEYAVMNKCFSSEVDLKRMSNYPKQINEHNAMNDAIWNYELYKFLQTV